MSEQQFKVGQQVRVKKHIHGKEAKYAGMEFEIEAVVMLVGGEAYALRGTEGIDGFYADELELVAPPDDELTRLRAENRRLLSENTRLQKWLDDIHADDIMVFQHATVYDYNRAGVVAFKVRDFDVDTFKTLADGHTQVIVTVYPVAAAEEALKPGADGGA